MEWIKIAEEKPDNNKMHYLTNGKTVFVVGNKLNPFFIQLYGEFTTIADFTPTHWTTLPELPNIPEK